MLFSKYVPGLVMCSCLRAVSVQEVALNVKAADCTDCKLLGRNIAVKFSYVKTVRVLI
jgi:hypothetical protein